MAENGAPNLFEVPNNQPFQFNGENDGSVGQDVNQFKGAVTFSVPLVSLSGRSGLSMEVSASYNSSVAVQVGSSNRDTPTGVLGLGWNLLIDRIDAVYSQPGSREGAIFFLTRRGSRNRLYATNRLWQRAELPASFSTSLDQGKITTDIVKALLSQTMILASEGKVRVISPGNKWMIMDPVHEYQLLVCANDTNPDVLTVYDGGVGYEQEGYDFSQIRYYEAFEKWEIITTNGNSCIFGGGCKVDAEGNHSSIGDSISWAVCWGNWAGPSRATHDAHGRRLQRQYPVSWAISVERAVNRDAITYEYRQTRQRVGIQGLFYTKASYLGLITDMFGRTVTLEYLDKVWNEDAGLPREYLDPRKAVPDNLPDAYQSTYEDKYLDSLICRNKDGEILLITTLSYDLQLFCEIPGNAPRAYGGDRYKRSLASVSQKDQDGVGLPDLCFTYHCAGAVNAGAIASKILPEGSVVLYSYQQKSLSRCTRSLTINSSLPGATPRIWFGPDYAVVLWISSDCFSLTVYTWSGRWIPWRPAGEIFRYACAPDDIITGLEKDFFVLSIADKANRQSLLLYFHKNNRILGGWLENGDNSALLPARSRNIVTGSRLFAFAEGETNTVTRLAWDPRGRMWVRQNLPTPPDYQSPSEFNIFLAASANLLCVLYYDRLSEPGYKRSLMALHTLDEFGAWKEKGSRQAKEIVIAGATATAVAGNIQWSASDWVFAATVITKETNARIHYAMLMYTWDDAPEFAWNPPFSQSCAMDIGINGAWPYNPKAVIQNTGMVASGPCLLRFNGHSWLANTNLKLQQPVGDKTFFWFAAGQDIVVKTENSPDHVIGMAQVYNPNSDDELWNELPITLYNGPTDANRTSRYYPTAGNDLISFDSTFYYRGASCDWQDSVRQPFPGLPPGTNTTTLINQAPDFMVYLSEAQGRSPHTEVLLMDCGMPTVAESIFQNFYRGIGPDATQDADSNGKIAAGNGSFVSFLPLDASFDTATSLTLYRFLNGSILQPVQDFPVHTVAVDDGYVRKRYEYDFDLSTAAVDSQGYSCKYYNSAVMVADGSLSGSTRYTFINGIGGQTPGNPVQEAVLDGLIAKKELFDAEGNRVGIQHNFWQPVEQVEDPRTGEVVTLAGIFAQLAKTATTVDGVEQLRTYVYSPVSGAVIRVSTQVHNALGCPETQTKNFVPAYTLYPQMARLNMLEALVGGNVTVAVDNAAPVKTAEERVTMELFPGPNTGAAGRLQLFCQRDFYRRLSPGAGNPEDAPEEWSLQSKVLRRTPLGEPAETADSLGVISSVLYSDTTGLVIGSFSVTSLARDEGYYFGFEPYESSGSWKLDTRITPIVTAICHTGSRCLSLPPGVSGVPLELTPEDTAKPYLFGFRGVVDPKSPAQGQAVAWHIEYISNTAASLPPPQTITVSGSEWRYYCAAVDLRGLSAPVTIRFTPVNEGNSTVFIDNVCFAPLHADLNIKVFDTKYYLQLAEIGPYTQIARTIYDRKKRQIAYTSEYDSVINVITPYLSREDAPLFDQDNPNAQIVFQPMGKTYFERFKNNGAWTRHFSSPTPEDWESREGFLNYTGSTGGKLLFTDTAFTDNYALNFEFRSNGLPKTAGIRIGGDLDVSWDGPNMIWQLIDRRNGFSAQEQPALGLPDGDWTIILTDKAFLFFVNGRKIFDYLPILPVSGQPCLHADYPVSIRRVIIGERPQVAVKYFNGSSQSLQGQSLEGARTVVTSTVYDAVARPLVEVKPVEYQGNPGSTGSLLLFRKENVTAFDWTTGILKGAAADFYPKDEGYPYVRRTVEASPLGRPLLVGAPGKKFAITGPGAPDGHVVRYAYGSNTDATVNAALGLPAGRYRCVTTTDQDGRVSIALSSADEQAVASAVLLDKGADKWLFSLESTEHSPSGSTTTVRVPNYYAPPAGSAASDWVNVTTKDLLGLACLTSTPDGGLVKEIRDALGRTRFVQNAVVELAGFIIYSKYDLSGRIVEAGLVKVDWDEKQLRIRADMPEWPGVRDGAQAVRSYEYGGDVLEVNNLGRTVRTINHGETGVLPAVSNSYAYNDNGLVETYGLHIEDDGKTYATRFTYDNLGNSVGTVYASGYSLFSEYDGVGRVRAVRDGNGVTLASYTYRPDDQVSEQTVLPGTPSAFTTVYDYASPGWVETISSRYMHHALGYTQKGFNGAVSYSGRPGTARTEFHGLTDPAHGFPAALEYLYSYDTRGQLSSAAGKANSETKEEYSFGLDGNTQYDPNGNFLRVQDGEHIEKHTYRPATNQVINTDGSTREDFTANGVGSITSATPRGITSIDYHALSQQPAVVETESNGPLKLYYDTQSNRVRKTTPTVTRTYVRSVIGWPLVEMSETPASSPATTEYLYGPEGIFALRRNGQIYPVLTDHLKSVRGLVDSGGRLLAAFHYSPFGRVIAQHGAADELLYRFTGYEIDPETSLYNAAARLYDPWLKRFYSTDPKMQFYSPYVYADNNPVVILDPSGEEAAWWAILVGSIVGIAATVATGGLLAPAVAGLEGAAALAVGAGVAATAGAVGTLAGDATTAGLASEKFTAKRALIDVLGGAAGGAAGTLAGGAAASVAMRGALAVGQNLSARAVNTIGTLTAGIVGGTAGAAAQGGVASAMTGQSFFSAGNIVSIAIGGAAGFGGALLASGAHMGWGGKTMPVPLGRDDFNLLDLQLDPHSMRTTSDNKRFITFNPEDYFRREPHYTLNAGDHTVFNVIDVHGSKGTVYPTITNGRGKSYLRPMGAKLFGEYLQQNRFVTEMNGPIKLSVCYAGKSGWFTKPVGATMATALGKEIRGATTTVFITTGAPANKWRTFM